MNEKLLDCPLCGGEPKQYGTGIECKNCGCGVFGAEKWNTRHDHRRPEECRGQTMTKNDLYKILALVAGEWKIFLKIEEAELELEAVQLVENPKDRLSNRVVLMGKKGNL